MELPVIYQKLHPTHTLHTQEGTQHTVDECWFHHPYGRYGQCSVIINTWRRLV